MSFTAPKEAQGHVAAVEVVRIGAPRVPAAPAPPAQRSRASRDPVGMPDMLIMLPWEFCTLSPGSRQRGRAGNSCKRGNPLRCVRARPRPPFVTIVAHSRTLMTPRLRARRGRVSASHQYTRVHHNGHKGWAGAGPDTSEGVPTFAAVSRSAALATSWAQPAEFQGLQDQHVSRADGVAGGAGALRGRRGGGRGTWRTDPHHLHRRHVLLSLPRSCERRQSYPPRYGAPLADGDCCGPNRFSGKMR